MTRTPLLVAFVLAIAPVAGAKPNKRVTPHPNVILITVDTLRADRLGCYGAKDIATPALDGLAQDGTVFERAIVQVPLTLPSHVTILTGTLPFWNGVQDFSGQPLPAGVRTLAQAFKRNGYATAAVVSSIVLDRSWGLARGFDFYDDRFSPAAMLQRDLGLVDRRADESVDAALQWLKNRPRKPVFLWLHLYDPHSPYDPPEPFRSQYKGRLYDGEVAYADSQLQRLIGWLKQQRLYDDAMIVMLSDHGESLGEHGEQEHGFFVYNATVRVPLIVKLPAGSPAQPKRVSRPVESAAVAATILEAAGISDPIRMQLQARSLFALPDNTTSAAYSESLYPFHSFGWSPLHALQDERYHYIEAPQPELYDLDADPQETTNVVAGGTEVASRLKQQLRQRLFVRAPRVVGGKAGSPGVAMEEQLRALGYFASRTSGPENGRELADPKQELPQLNAILAAADAFRANDFERGRRLLEHVLQQEPEMYVAYFMLGEAALRQAEWQQAASLLEHCLQLGDTDGAIAWVNRAVAQNPQNYRAWYELGWLQTPARPALAEQAFARALAVQPGFALARRDLGRLQFGQKDYANAARNLEYATRLGLSDAKTYNLLGIAYSRTNRLPAAVESYKKALAEDADLADAHLNLAYAYQRLQQRARASREYETACRLDTALCQYVPRHVHQ